MHDSKTAATLRAILDELCVELAPSDVRTRVHVASKLLETAKLGLSIDDLKKVGKVALKQPPTMWR